jgi:pyruvate-ferredoxin/flavodoxin oxidoreductase
MNPVFVHDPRRARRCTTGSPSTATPTSTRPGRPHLEYRRRERRPAADDDTADTGGVRPRRDPLQEAVPPAAAELEAIGASRSTSTSSCRAAARHGVPFIYATDDDRAPDQGRRARRRSSPWSRTGAATGRRCSTSPACTRRSSPRCTERLRGPQGKYEQALAQRESSLDDIARAMSELAPRARRRSGSARSRRGGHGAAAAASGRGRRPADRGGRRRWGDADLPRPGRRAAKCTDCGTCYQELPQFFEKTPRWSSTARREGRADDPRSAGAVEMTPESQASSG